MDSTGLYYYGARYYDPEIGRFITRDTWTYLPNDFRSFGKTVPRWMSDPQVFNRYSFCRNNPLVYIDPDGHGWLGKLLSGSGLAVATIAVVIVIASGGTGLPLALALLSYAIAYATYVYECWYKTTRISTKVKFDQHKDIEEVEQRVDDKIVGGWYKVKKGYMVWSEEENDYVFVPENDWEPPPLPEEGAIGGAPITDENLITIENYPPGWNDEPKEPNKDSSDEISTSTSSHQGSSVPSIGPVARGYSIN